VEGAGPFDESLGQIVVDAPVAVQVGVGQGAVGDAAPEAQVVELAGAGAETSFDVGQTVSVSHLAKGHAEELVPAREGFDLVVSRVTADAALELLQMDEIHKLRECEFFGEHCRSLARNLLREKRGNWSVSLQVEHTPRHREEPRKHWPGLKTD
jgi:hypothetical protein